MHLYRGLIIIPCFNEAASLADLVTEIKENLRGILNLDILIVNDCSTDNTLDIAQRTEAKYLDLPVNLGIGGAMQAGFLYAYSHNYSFVIQLDGDGQHVPSEIKKLIAAFEKTEADIIIGSRFLEKKGFQSSFLRRIGINYFYLINRLFTGLHIKDSTSGFRLLNKKAFSYAAFHYPDDFPEPESIVIFAKKKFSIAEVPVIMRERQGGKSSIRWLMQLYYIIKVSIAMCFSYIRK
ncbi:MAG: glycosyl transferase family 2 [Chitinophaga sp.]|jgi:glycosyltransferase involved in cell wall biosynthesis|nr:glycosyl transferase family 2 [Chitinophaga sp.]